MDETKQLGEAPIGKLLAKFAVPAVIASLVNAIYNIVDRIFVANFVGEGAIGGLQAGFPIMLFILGLGLLCAIGFSTMSSIQLGKKDAARANRLFGNGILVVVVLTALTTLLSGLFLEPLLKLSSSDATVIAFGKSYTSIIVYAQFFQMASLYLANYARIEGRVNLSMISQIVAALTNILLDYVFIGPLDMGVEGAAWATIIGQAVGLVILFVFYFCTKKSLFRLHRKDFVPSLSLIGGALAIGISSFIMQIGNVISNVAMNNALEKYAPAGITILDAMAAASSVFTLILMPLIGIKDGVVPIIGYNYGAQKYDRAKRALKLALIAGFCFTAIVFLVVEIFPEFLLGIFFKPDNPVMPYAVTGLRLDFAALPFSCINVIGTAYLQSTKRTVSAFAASISRQIAFLWPLTYILPLFWGLSGVWACFPASDILSILLTLVLLAVAFRQQRADRCAAPAEGEIATGEIFAGSAEALPVPDDLDAALTEGNAAASDTSDAPSDAARSAPVPQAQPCQSATDAPAESLCNPALTHASKCQSATDAPAESAFCDTAEAELPVTARTVVEERDGDGKARKNRSRFNTLP